MAEKKADGYRPYSDDPSANLWSTYLVMSEKYDSALAQDWKGDMDAILIFAGLFSASVTAFIIESYKTLNPDPSVILLAQISQQLALIGNGTLPVDPSLSQRAMSSQQNSSPPLSSLVCNILWFLSLGLSLACALSATLIEQWTRHYLQAINSKPSPQDRARLRTYLFQGLERYRMPAIVDAIPALLHTSLFLFFAGLIAFLTPINPILAYLIAALLALCCILYILVTVIPVFDLSCPYSTPLSSLFWILCRKLGLLHRYDVGGNKTPVLSRMSEAQEQEATDITPQRDRRDFEAMCWSISALRKAHEIESFIEVIPAVISGLDYSAKWLMDALMHHDDISVNLGFRLPRILATCVGRQLDPIVAERRAITCLKSIWSLTMLSIPKPSGSEPTPYRRNLKFKEDAFDLFRAVQAYLPAVKDYVLSASVVVARGLMDMQLDQVMALEEQLLHLLKFGQPKISSLHNEPRYLSSVEKERILLNLKDRMQRINDHISQEKTLTAAHPHVMIETALLLQRPLVSLAATPIAGIENDFVCDVLGHTKAFKVALNQAGFNLTLEYVANILDSDSLPHEAFNTIRRTFFRINFQMPISRASQERLVNYLEEAVEHTSSWTTRLPQSIVDVLLGLTRALTEMTLIRRAIAIIERHLQLTPSDAARSSLVILERALPDEVRNYQSVEFLGSHIYADAKPNRKPRSRANTVVNSS
ncbi:hypothetical protein CPB84DRAFT_1764420 [Gymnopilus junonius]|uniref:DUF6535 domain-containing protein n=1 Tax=Gymnopilus junonius TaxID=109634 RepID=A0A9P5NYT5_GYMJU|nr:hypothetical protein CPB84DRAFT_1764420 [Gymnopilus junonius]